VAGTCVELREGRAWVYRHRADADGVVGHWLVPVRQMLDDRARAVRAEHRRSERVGLGVVYACYPESLGLWAVPFRVGERSSAAERRPWCWPSHCSGRFVWWCLSRAVACALYDRGRDGSCSARVAREPDRARRNGTSVSRIADRAGRRHDAVVQLGDDRDRRRR